MRRPTVPILEEEPKGRDFIRAANAAGAWGEMDQRPPPSRLLFILPPPSSGTRALRTPGFCKSFCKSLVGGALGMDSYSGA